MPKKAKVSAKSDPTTVESLQPLLETMITLLGRLVYPPEKITEIITKSKRKKDPKDYVRAYNLCDGEHTLSQIAEAIDVVPGTLSPILSGWKELGIIYETTKKGGQFYKRLYRLGHKLAETPDEKDEATEPVVTVNHRPSELGRPEENPTQSPSNVEHPV